MSKETGKQKTVLQMADLVERFHIFLVIALADLQCSQKSLRTCRGAENPTGPKLPDFTLLKELRFKSKILLLTHKAPQTKIVVEFAKKVDSDEAAHDESHFLKICRRKFCCLLFGS